MREDENQFNFHCLRQNHGEHHFMLVLEQCR